MMKKKLGAIVLATTMVLSLVGCSKKNFDGNYTGEYDMTDIYIDYMEDGWDKTGYNWEGKVTETYKLEISEGEYTLVVDKKAFESSVKAFLDANLEDFLYYEYDATEEDFLEAGYTSVWEFVGYSDKDETIAAEIEADIENLLEDDEDGTYEIDGDVITLGGVDIVDGEGDKGKGWPLTYEDGDLVGQLYVDEDSDDMLEIRFVRDEE